MTRYSVLRTYTNTRTQSWPLSAPVSDTGPARPFTFAPIADRNRSEGLTLPSNHSITTLRLSPPLRAATRRDHVEPAPRGDPLTEFVVAGPFQSLACAQTTGSASPTHNRPPHVRTGPKLPRPLNKAVSNVFYYRDSMSPSSIYRHFYAGLY